MDKENTEKIFADFPRLYREPGGRVSFECDNGWFQLIHDLSARIEAKARELGIDPNSEDWPHVMGVKEKFGKLRMLVITPKIPLRLINELISEAEAKSATTCEVCGQPGIMRPGTVWQVRCDACDAQKSRKS